MIKLFMTKSHDWFHPPHRFMLVILLLFGLVACTAKNNADIQRIALIAPFEGRYSEIGYDAYYAVRLAIMEHGSDTIELLAIDDGGTEASATERAKALANDPLVKVVIALGMNATQPEAQQNFEQLPVIIVGQWHTKPAAENVYMLTSKQLESIQTVNSATLEEAAQAQSPFVGGEIFALSQFPLVSKNLDNVKIASSASLPDADFRKRYRSSGQYVPEPGLLATLSYDAAGMALEALKSGNSKSISTIAYTGLNGDIRFVDGYWADAPLHYYRYDENNRLAPEDSP
jgi:hypothetical protein